MTGFSLITEDESRAAIRGYLDSREWWIIPWISSTSSTLSALIEETFYVDEAGADFHLFALAIPGVRAASFAHKRHASPEQVSELTGLPADMLREHDVLMTLEDAQDSTNAVVAALAFHDWVMGNDGWKPKKA